MDSLSPPDDLHSSAISFRYISRPEQVNTRLFEEIYDVYKFGFPHGARQPGFFGRMFAQNVNESTQRKWGPAHYEILYASRGGKVIATAMFASLFAPINGWPDSNFHAAVGIDYRSVLPEARGGGMAGELEKRLVGRTVARLKASGRIRHASEAKKVPFNERSSPLDMSFGDFADDVRKVGTHPFGRVGTWDKAGLHRILPSEDIDKYIEPASVDGDPECDTYCFSVKTGGAPIGALTVADIVLRYAAFRRMNGADPRDKSATFAEMHQKILKKEFFVPIVDTPLLTPWREAADALLGRYPVIPAALAHRSVRELIAEHA